MPKFKITWTTREADTGRAFTAERIIDATDAKELALSPDMTSEPAPDDAPLYNWRTVKGPE